MLNRWMVEAERLRRYLRTSDYLSSGQLRVCRKSVQRCPALILDPNRDVDGHALTSYGCTAGHPAIALRIEDICLKKPMRLVLWFLKDEPAL